MPRWSYLHMGCRSYKSNSPHVRFDPLAFRCSNLGHLPRLPQVSAMSLQPVILSGGSGTRLWPLSREAYPKQFLALTSDYTMLQETVRRLDGLEEEHPHHGVGMVDPIVVCNEAHRFLVAEQMRLIGRSPAAIILEGGRVVGGRRERRNRHRKTHHRHDLSGHHSERGIREVECRQARDRSGLTLLRNRTPEDAEVPRH